MDRRIKVWLSVLIALLIAAIAALLGVNAQFAGSQEALEAASAQLAVELEKNETLAAGYESMEAELAQAQADYESMEAELAQAQADYESMEAELAQAQADYQQQAEAQQSAQATIETLEAEADGYAKRIEELESAAGVAQARIDELTLAIENSATEVPVTEAPATATPEATVAPTVEVPVVTTPEILTTAAPVNVEEIYADIDSIVGDTTGMTDEEKVMALEQLKADLAVYLEELNAALEAVAEQEAALIVSADSIKTLEGELVAAQQNVDELTQAIAESNDVIAGLEAQIEALSAENASNSTDAQAQIAALESDIDAEKSKVEGLSAELAVANSEMEDLAAELEVYKMARELNEGEAYTASTLAETLQVAADGKTVAWNYENDTISGNTVVLTILIDGEEIYRSEALQPGAVITAFELNRTLEAGEYEAVAVTGVYDAEGNFAHSTRVPVMIKVG